MAWLVSAWILALQMPVGKVIVMVAGKVSTVLAKVMLLMSMICQTCLGENKMKSILVATEQKAE